MILSLTAYSFSNCFNEREDEDEKMCVDTRASNCCIGHLGLAIADCSKEKGLPSLVLERSNGIASLWKLKNYDQLRLHLPKQFCELPFMSFSEDFPTYPSKKKYVQYLEAYAKKFNMFNTTVVVVKYEQSLEFWNVQIVGLKDDEID